MELTCPKCHGTMRTYERNGVHVDQCADCRGIFLDRGELDRLIDAENDWHGGAPPAAPQHAARSEQHQESSSSGGLGSVVGEVLRQVQGAKSSSHRESAGRESAHRESDYRRPEYGHQKRKKESFLGELFG
jgi:Zn-finger nucleic acid-binding protein